MFLNSQFLLFSVFFYFIRALSHSEIIFARILKFFFINSIFHSISSFQFFYLNLEPCYWFFVSFFQLNIYSFFNNALMYFMSSVIISNCINTASYNLLIACIERLWKKINLEIIESSPRKTTKFLMQCSWENNIFHFYKFRNFTQRNCD